MPGKGKEALEAVQCYFLNNEPEIDAKKGD